jgi:hypothetical protein
MSNTSDRQEGARRAQYGIDDSVEGHKVRDTGDLAPAEDEDLGLDDSVEGHAVNHRPLDNGATPLRKTLRD